ncbi:MAG: hypothetical protein IKW17_07475, partial [Paludibacteraceae bacterium]|nr:hypothetical protein [Paludibacteraceae bacterium]
MIYHYQTYYYWIQPVCDGVGGEWTMVNKFETFCPTVHTIPYVQDFESAEPGCRIWTGFTADCMYAKQWSRNIPNATPSGRYDNKYYYPCVTNTRGYNSNQSFPIFKKYTSSSRNYVALPEFDKPIDSLQVSFRIFSHQSAHMYWNTQEIAVGVMTDPMDMNTFEQVALLKPSKQTTWERVVVKFNEYTGNGKYIAIRETDKFTMNPSYASDYEGGKNLDTLYVDNIEVNIAAPCDIPYDIYASDVTPNAATINWQSDANEFIVVVANTILSENDLVDLDDYKAGRLPSFANEAAIVSVDTVVGAHNVRVNELTINQDYYVYIKAFCQNMYTDYAVDYTFSTYCPAMPVESFFADFSDAATGTTPDCWFVGKTVGEYQSSQSILTYVKVATSGGNCLLLSSTNGAIVSTTNKPSINGTYAITPSLDIDKITDYKVKFKAWTGSSYAYSGCGSYDYARSVIVGVVTNPYNFETFMPVDTIENIHYSSYPYEVYLDSYKYDLNGDTGKFVAFYSNFGIKNNIYIDDVEFELIDDCPRFEAEVVSTTPSSITLEFSEVPSSYVVKATNSALNSSSSLDNDSIYPPVVGTSKNVTIDGLKNHKEYFFYARSTADTLCNEWQLVTSGFAADSLAKAIPFIDGFEDNPYVASYGACPHDWYGYYKDGDVSYPTIGSTASSGTKGAYMYTSGSTDIYLVSPELIVDKLSDCYLECNIYAGAVNTYPAMRRAITLGVVSDVNNIAGTFTPLDTLIFEPEQLGKFNYARLELSGYNGTAKHIAFKVDYAYNVELFSAYKYATFNIDEVVVDYIPSCYTPNSFSTKAVTDNSISLDFKHEGAVRYEAIYGFSGFNLDSVAVSPSYAYSRGVDTISFTSKEFTINSLLSEVNYDVYVRALCTEQDASDFVHAGTYKTLPSMISSFPYTNNFEDPVENANWKHHGSSGYAWYMGVD